MQGLMENVLKAPAGMQQVRAYLYGSLLYYLTMTTNQHGEAAHPGRGEEKGSVIVYHSVGMKEMGWAALMSALFQNSLEKAPKQ